MIPRTEDITLITGEEVVSPPISWLSKTSIFNIENIASVNASGDVIHFSRSDMVNDWQAVNVSSQTNIKIRSNLTSWQLSYGLQNGVSQVLLLLLILSYSNPLHMDIGMLRMYQMRQVKRFHLFPLLG